MLLPIEEPTQLTNWNVNLIPDLHGKVAIVTGANSPLGIGFHMAYQLACKGAKVYLGARSLAKAEEAIATMKKLADNYRELDLFPLVLDLGDFRQIIHVVRHFTSVETRLDILINNAALIGNSDTFNLDENGISRAFSVNHLGPFLFTLQLIPLIKSTATVCPGVRILMVTSTAHHMIPPGITFTSIDDFNLDVDIADDPAANLTRYSLSKLANILFANQLQRQLDVESIPAVAMSLHPGKIRTDGTIRMFGDERLALYETISVEDGALTGLFAATDPVIWEERDKYAAAYLVPFGVIGQKSENAQNEELAADLWELSDKVTKSILAQQT